MQTKVKIYYFLFSSLLIGAGWCTHILYDHYFTKKESRRVRIVGYEFISPLIDVELPEGYGVRHEPIPFKNKIVDIVNQQLKSGNARDISLYFRDLSDGPWFSINDNVKYNPASMMKVPVMIGWLKRAEKDPTVLKLKFTFDEKKYHTPVFKIAPEKSLKNGFSYSVDELLSYMMHFSDNNAMSVLYSELSDAECKNILDSMDVASNPDGDQDSITVHGYSGFLRILYNASFLNREMSEKALKLMSYQDFSHGIAAGLPTGVKLASKYGVYSTKENPDTIQLHEFGIVYHPKGPYILGIMTRGNNLNKQSEVIKSLSASVYKSYDYSLSTSTLQNAGKKRDFQDAQSRGQSRPGNSDHTLANRTSTLP